jgi:hypothetical protein
MHLTEMNEEQSVGPNVQWTFDEVNREADGQPFFGEVSRSHSSNWLQCQFVKG